MCIIFMKELLSCLHVNLLYKQLKNYRKYSVDGLINHIKCRSRSRAFINHIECRSRSRAAIFDHCLLCVGCTYYIHCSFMKYPYFCLYSVLKNGSFSGEQPACLDHLVNALIILKYVSIHLVIFSVARYNNIAPANIICWT